MANRNQDQQSGRSRSNYRDWEDAGNEAEGSVRGGSYDQGRVQYGRDTDDNSGSTGRYAGYGDWGQGDYGRSGRGANTGQNRYGQSGFGGGDYGSDQDNYSRDPERGSYGGSNYSGPGYGRSGNEERYQGSRGTSGSDSGYGYGGHGAEGRRQRSWNEPNGEGQQSGGSQRGWEGGGPRYGRSQSAGYHAGSGQSSGYGGPAPGDSRFGAPRPGSEFGYGGAQGGSPQDLGQSQGPHRGKGPKGYQRSDERVKEMISERLRDDPHVDASEITVTVSGGKVTLEGTVDSRQAKNSAEDIAEQCGCEHVQNNLRVQRSQQSSALTGSASTADKDEDNQKGESARQRH